MVKHFVDGGCTVNLCSIDLSKAFDKVDHCSLFMKLMKRQIPLKLLDTLVFWLQNSWSCVKWKSVFSQFFRLDYGVRQGSIPLPYLFALYVDDITNCLFLDRNHCLLCMPMILYLLRHRCPHCKNY